MKAAVLFTGGKDSCLALFKYGKDKVNCLLTIVPESKDSWMFHKPNVKLLKKQVEMLGLELITQKSKSGKEKELEDLKNLISLVKDKVNVIVVGGLASNYQGSRVKKICNELGLKFCAPLWDYSGEELWQNLLKNNFKVIITKISSEGIPKEFIGKIINQEKFEELKKLAERYKFRLDFEGGDAETAVLFMPDFKKEIKLKYGIKSEGKYRHLIKIIQIK